MNRVHQTRRSRMAARAGLIAVTVLAGLALAGCLLPGPTRTESVAIPLDGAERAELRIVSGVGQLTIETLAGGDTFLEGSLTLGGRETLDQEIRRDNGTLIVELRQESESVMNLPQSGDRSWDLALNGEVPVEVEIVGGVGQIVLDLEEAQVERLQVQGGVGESRITLPAAVDSQIDITSGVGRVQVRVPEGVGVEVRAQGGLGSVDMPAGYTESGGRYRSPDYENAAVQAQVRISSGVGEIEIVD